MSIRLDDLLDKALKNIENDRHTTEELLHELQEYLCVSKDRYADSGPVAAKFVETLQRSNEQLVKLASLIHKRESEKPDTSLSDKDKEELFQIIKEDK